MTSYDHIGQLLSSDKERGRECHEGIRADGGSSLTKSNLTNVYTSAAGAGARRVTAITQLYFRLASYPPLTIIVVDTLCVVFGFQGASLGQLVDYLGLAEDPLRHAIQSIPSELRCTSDDLAEQWSSSTGASSRMMNEEKRDVAPPALPSLPPGGGMQLNVSCGNSSGGDDGEGNGETHMTTGEKQKREGEVEDGGDEETYYFLNYKRILPFAYAHVCRLLLPLCVVPFSYSPSSIGSATGSLEGGNENSDSCYEGRHQSTGGVNDDNADTMRSLTTGISSLTTTTPCGGDGKVVPPLPAPPLSTPSVPFVQEWDPTSSLLLSSAIQKRLPDVREALQCRRCKLWMEVKECVPISAAHGGRGRTDANGIGGSPFLQHGRHRVTRYSNPSDSSILSGMNGTRDTCKSCLTPCPSCGEDIVQSTVQAIFEHYQSSLASGMSLLTVLPPSSSNIGWNPSLQPSPSSSSSTRFPPCPLVTRLLPHSLQCPLAKDPILVQQVLIFFELFSIPFGCLADDGAMVVDPAEILTKPEMLRRLSHTVRGGGRTRNMMMGRAEQFRATHRQPQSVHVQIVSSAAVEQRKLSENWSKLLKRSRRPPWMRREGSNSRTMPSSSFHALSFCRAAKKKKTFSAKFYSRRSTSLPSLKVGDHIFHSHHQTVLSHEEGDHVSTSEVARFVAEENVDDDFEVVEWPSPGYRLHRE